MTPADGIEGGPLLFFRFLDHRILASCRPRSQSVRKRIFRCDFHAHVGVAEGQGVNPAKTGRGAPPPPSFFCDERAASKGMQCRQGRGPLGKKFYSQNGYLPASPRRHSDPLPPCSKQHRPTVQGNRTMIQQMIQHGSWSLSFNGLRVFNKGWRIVWLSDFHEFRLNHARRGRAAHW